MEPIKKKTAWSNFRAKTKAQLSNIKMGKKGPGKDKKTHLKYRRSISVPDLRFAASHQLSSQHPILQSPCDDSMFFAGSSSPYCQSVAESGSSSPTFSEHSSIPDTPFYTRLASPPHASFPTEKVADPDVCVSPKRVMEVDSHAGTSPFLVEEASGQTERVGGAPYRVHSAPLIRPPVPAERHFFQANPVPAPAERPAAPKAISVSSEKKTTPVARKVNAPDSLSLPSEMSCASTTESGNSSPSEEQMDMDNDLMAMMEPMTPMSREMFIIGSAEDVPNTPNETSDYDTNSLLERIEGSVCASNETSDYDSNPLLERVEGSVCALRRGAATSLEVLTAMGQKVQYLLTINLKEGRNLVVRDRRGTSDPFVKFKIDGKTFYKSKVVNKNLNPAWNESFSYPVRDLEHKLYVKVYDRDLRSHDYMGGSCTSLNKLELEKTTELVLKLEDPNSKEADMGVIIIDACLSVRDGPTKRNRWMIRRRGSFGKGQSPAQGQQPQQPQQRGVDVKKNQVWSGVYSIVLVEGQDMPDVGQGDVYVRFRLGEQKFKSKNLCIKANPQWRETFDFNQLDGLELLQVEVCSKRGRKCEEFWGLLDIDLSRLPVQQRQLYTRVLDPGKGRLVFLITLTPCSGVSVSDLSSPPLDDLQTSERVRDHHSLKNSLKNMKDVGFVQIKVIKATDLASADLGGKSDPFCALELGNSKLQTQTIHKTLNPEWNKVFTLPIKDIHDVLVLTVYDDDRDKPPDFLGKVAVPLLSIHNGQAVTKHLKKDNLGSQSKGTISLEMDVIYNPVRAGIRSFGPTEIKFMEDNPKFNKKLLARNIYRVRRISGAILYTLQYIKSCFQWESTQRSITAFLIFVLTVWQWELFMLPLFLLLLIAWNYFQNTPGAVSHSQDLENMSVAEDDEEDEKESEKKGLMEKIHMVQETVLIVQNTLDEVASVAERIKNTFNWSVPFLSFLACIVFFGVTAALYFIPLRYIVMIWGVNKFTKKLRDPYAIDNNEMLDFLKRVPSDVQKVQYSELRAPAANPQRKKR
ncbi:multiple C2 and transmembrane domain-containing protein 2 isoform X2 [Clupea harengus]|uniref:Multiple C2 and transmembrane domain-containing protein 2 isoform X2 n=1 Tax=Clupea harengus TaxID=7950 RepID=A0A6P8EVJ1_CLUHA|nr:multiple C2 and transmembrane domain-containing protein 2 isoform X2 [Clupea harengus]